MKTAKQVDELIEQLKSGGIPLAEAAWKTALACVGWPYIFGDRGQYCTPANRRTAYASHGAEHPTIKSKCKNFEGTGSCSGCQFYPGGKTRAFDCRGFTYWVLLRIYGWKLQGAGATSQWNNADNWKAKGEIGTMPKNTLCCLFVQKGKKMEHTCFGLNNETVECSNGVQHFTSRNKKWTHWAVPACEEGDVPVPTPTPTPGKPTLKKGSSGQYVTLLQTELINRGYSCGKSGADGKFGNDTLTAVKAFQKDHGLTADGIVGPQTWNALDNAEPTVYYTVTIPHLTQAAANQLLTNYPGGSMTKE